MELTGQGLTLKRDALEYARSCGWPVFPVHSVRDGMCTCGSSDCTSQGKHPRTGHGFKDATRDPAVITEWWDRLPDSNIGIPTGSVSGLVVLDIDPRNGGDDSLWDLEEQYSRLPATAEVITGGGGRHIYFAYPDGIRQIKSKTIASGVEIKADGSYVVAPHSLHISGRRYEWEISSVK